MIPFAEILVGAQIHISASNIEGALEK